MPHQTPARGLSGRNTGAPRPASLALVAPELVESTAHRLGVLGHPDRVRVLLVLVERPATVAELARRVGIDANAMSSHLARLREAGVVRGTRRGNFVRYALTDAETIKGVVLIARGAQRERDRLAGLARTTLPPATARPDARA